MMGRSHIVTGTASTIAVVSGCAALEKVLGADQFGKVGSFFFKMLSVPLCPITRWCEGSYVLAVVIGVLSYLFLCFGLLLPDIDSKTSLLGRVLYIPVEHRTWTHTVWAVILLLIPTVISGIVLLTNYTVLAWICYWIFSWVAWGYATHLFWDALSVGGVCWFYPISQYKTYSGGARVKVHHKIKIYRTGGISEAIVCVFVVFIAAGILVACAKCGVYAAAGAARVGP